MLTWLVDKLCKPGSIVWGNCFYAFLLLAKSGGAIIITKSESGGLTIRTCWATDLPQVSVRRLIPLKRRKGWRAYLHCWFFRGKWVRQVIGITPIDGEASDATPDNYGAKTR